MQYREKQFDESNHLLAEYNYLVTYNREKLIKIMEELKSYKYTIRDKATLSGNILTKWPLSDSIIKNRVVSFFNKKNRDKNAKIYPDTIIHHTSNNNDYVTYEYSYEKLPDLYYYLDIIVNQKDIVCYLDLFNIVNDRIHAIMNRDQILINAIFDYIDSKELDDNGINSNNQELRKLYEETLKCLNFIITSVKTYEQHGETKDGLSLQRKLFKGYFESNKN